MSRAAKSNLGMYQWMTKAAKRVGGPVPLILIIGACGYGAIRTGECGIKFIYRKSKKHFDKKDADTEGHPVYSVIANAKIDGETSVKPGDRIKILDSDDDAVMIEIIGGEDNPYFVDASYLESIIDYDNMRDGFEKGKRARGK